MPSSARDARRAALAADPALFEPLCEGERADALRVMTEDRRLATMAKVARYRVTAVEPLVVKPPHGWPDTAWPAWSPSTTPPIAPSRR